MTIVLFILVLALLILTHELGHFIVAKLSGIRVDEFGLGLPPKVFGVKKGETTYSINALPFGGFVKIFGEDPNEENTSGPDSARSFVHKPKWIQALVLAAGVTFNLIFAWILISINLMIGMPVATDGGVPAGMTVHREMLAVVNVLKDSPAALGGIKAGDQLISLSSGQEKVVNLSADSVRTFVKKFPNQEVKVEYSRKGLLATSSVLTVIPKTNSSSSDAMIGIAMQKIGLVSAAWWKAPCYGLYFSYHLIVNTFLSFGDFFSMIATEGQGALAAVSGPIGIYGLMNDATKMGLVYILNFMVIISVNLAIINLLPFPALDGGRLLFVAIEAVIRRPIKPVIANTLNMIGFGLLLLLMAVIAISDIFKLL
ncbi:MAG: site-2 protease family protein [Candidatus Paceibacterota bacterium]|jgi:regulator of sigma E protease